MNELQSRPKAQRSRACNQCRERRVKCDETPDFCQQCRRLGLACSGPVQGSVIIDMTNKITKPRARKKKDVSHVVASTPTAHEQDVTNHPPAHAPDTPQNIVPGTGTSDIVPRKRTLSVRLSGTGQPHAQLAMITALRWQYKLPTVYEPSLIQMYDQAFISHFVDLHNRSRTNMPEVLWLTRLHEIHSKTAEAALGFAIRAASMAFYARLHQNFSVLTDSYRWYIASLHRQRLSLSNLDSRCAPDNNSVLVPIILGVYEVYAGTTPMSVFQHLTAASKILEMIGPRNCALGVAHQLLRALRVSDAHKCLIFNQASIFSSPEWLTLPFTIRSKNSHQELTDIVLSIPPCLSLCRIPGPLNEFFARPVPPNTDLTVARTQTARLLVQLNEWASRFPDLCDLDSSVIVKTASPSPKGSTSTSPSSPSPLPDPAITFNALSSSTYHAVHLTLLLLQHKVSTDPLRTPEQHSTRPKPIPESVLQKSRFHTESILQNSAHLEDNYPLGFDFMRSVFPLVVVSSIAPRDVDKRAADDILARWGARRGVGGICGPWIGR